MGESEFLDQKIEKFKKAHPEKDGWQVFMYGRDPFGYIGYIPEFLKAERPEWLKKQDITPLADMKEKKKSKKLAFNCVSWLGLIELEVDREPVHYFTFQMAPTGNLDRGNIHKHLVAVKNMPTIEKIHNEICRYVKRRTYERREIMTINGANILRSKCSWDDLILPNGISMDIKTNVEAFFESKDKYKELGIPYRRGFLFIGPPGNGKTLTARILTTYRKISFINVLVKSDLAEEQVGAALNFASAYAPSILLFEDLDKIRQCRELSLSYLLNRLDGLDVTEGVLVIATSNEPQKLDPALLHRPSRFDRIWTFPLPEYEQRFALLKKLGSARFSQEALEKAASETSGFSMAYVQEVITSAFLTSICAKEKTADKHLAQSLAVLKKQFKAMGAKSALAGNNLEALNIGFGSNGND